jgi:Lrp/AsnC family transcriptional regulator, leucine-responsive regulatory protein
MMTASLDQFDLKILSLLQQDNQRTFEDLSRLVNLSSSACRRRVEALRRGKIIIRDASVIEPAAVKKPLMVVALVKLEHDEPEAHKSFRAMTQLRPEVIQAFFTAGTSDYVLLLSVKTVQEYEVLTEAIFTANSNVRYFESMIVMSRVKWGTTIPIDDASILPR